MEVHPWKFQLTIYSDGAKIIQKNSGIIAYMPEVAEVVLTVEVLKLRIQGRRLMNIHFLSGRYQKRHPSGSQKFINALPLKLKDVSSKGKFIWFKFEDSWFLMNTLGLTGGWNFDDNGARILLEFENINVYYWDTRNFGTFKFVQNGEVTRKIAHLAPDVLRMEFRMGKVRQYYIPIVKILMDQKKVVSGLGNYLTAEILYRAHISPHRLGSDLSDQQVERLEYWTKYLVKLAYLRPERTDYLEKIWDDIQTTPRTEYHPDIKLGPEHFQFWVYRKKYDPLGNPVVRSQIVRGRTTYWVPNLQE